MSPPNQPAAAVAAPLPPLQIVRVYPNLGSVYHVRRQPAAVVAQVQRLFEQYMYCTAAGQAPLDFIAEIFAFDREMAYADGYRVVATADPATPRYDFWRYADHDGLVFETGTTTLTGVAYAEGEFFVSARHADPHGRAAPLAAALNAAAIVDAPGLDPDAPLIIEHGANNRWLVGFTEPAAVPTTPAGWDELFDGNYFLMHEDFVRRYGPDFGPEAHQQQWSRAVLSEAYIREFAQTDDDWQCVLFSQKLSEAFIREFADRMRWQSLAAHQTLSEAFIREFQDRLNWSSGSMSQRMSEAFIREFADRLDWQYISIHQTLSEEFIAEFADRIDFRALDPTPPRTEAFYRAYQPRLDWATISRRAPLSEALIRAFADQVNWTRIAEYQPLSTAFLDEFAARLDWAALARNRHLTDEQRRHFQTRLA